MSGQIKIVGKPVQNLVSGQKSKLWKKLVLKKRLSFFCFLFFFLSFGFYKILIYLFVQNRFFSGSEYTLVIVRIFDFYQGIFTPTDEPVLDKKIDVL